MKNHRQTLRVILVKPDLSNREIARQILCSPGTISRLRSRVSILGLTLAQLDAMKDSEIRDWAYDQQTSAGDLVWPDWDAVLADLQAGYNRQEAYDRFVDRLEDGQPIAYRTFCKHTESVLDTKNPTMRLLHRPGDKAMVDFAGYTPPGMIDGSEVNFQLFVARLPASGYGFACVVASHTIPDWLAANEAMFRHFGGATTYLVSDNLRAAVTAHRRGKPPVINTTFASFAEHYTTTVYPARPHEPQDKAAVERFVQDVQRKVRLALRGRPRLTMTQMNELLLKIVAELNNKVPRAPVTETRRQLFERIDQPVLKDLPAEEFLYFAEKQCKVPRDYHVSWDHIEYSVPHRLIDASVIIRADRSTIRVLHDGQLVALHQRRWGTSDPVTEPDHMLPNHRVWRAEETTDLVLWARNWPEAVQIVAGAVTASSKLSGKARDQQFALFTKLARAHGKERFIQACDRACAVGDPSIRHVRNLLHSRRQSMPVAPPPVTALPTADENVRGAAYYAGGNACPTI